jgi:hypothetical protein
LYFLEIFFLGTAIKIEMSFNKHLIKKRLMDKKNTAASKNQKDKDKDKRKKYNFPVSIFIVFEKINPIVFTSKKLTKNHYVFFADSN